ncbi:hypothetical protein [Vibrio cidicii]|uniref:hypothetical protein n=1 Tax=Vibrio cidicii TaxID=1763883 RepID=UPI0018C1F6F3|nr:hypothetical protein [Vibrio cidicii]MBG0757687.1 hypothetical protein [Vibrio cidicii]
MSFIKGIKEKINVAIVICITVLTFSNNVYADSDYAVSGLFSDKQEGIDCESPREFSRLSGNRTNANYLPPCSSYLEQYDYTLVAWNWLLTKDEYDENSSMFESYGNDPNQQRVAFRDSTFDWGIGLDLIVGFFAMIVTLICIIQAFSYMSNNEQKGVPRPVIFILVGSTLIALFSWSFARAKLLLYIALIHNSIALNFHNVEDELAVYKKGYLETLVSDAKDKNNQVLSNALHKSILEREIFERNSLNKWFGTSTEFEDNGTFWNSDQDLSAEEYFRYAYECFSTYKADVYTSSEWNFTNGFNFVNKIPDEIVIKYGGETQNNYCNRLNFGYEIADTTIKSDFPNVMTNFFQGIYKEDMSEETSVYEDAKGLFDISLGNAEKTIAKVVEAGSNMNMRNDGSLMQALAAVKQADPNRKNIKSTESYQRLVEQFEKDFSQAMVFEDSFSVEERLNLSNLTIEAYKMAILGGYEHGEIDATYEQITGFQAFERFMRETARLNLEYHAAKKSDRKDFMFRQKRADEFNRLDLTKDNDRYSANIASGFDLDGFEFNYSSVDIEKNKDKRFSIKAVGDPDRTIDLYREVVDRKLAVQTLFNAIDTAGYRWAMSNAEAMDEELIVEMLNSIKPSFQSVTDFKNAQIDKRAGLNQVLNSEVDLYTITTHSWNTNEPQTFYPYPAVGIDISDVDGIELYDKQNELKKYDASMLLSNAYSARTPNVVSDKSWLERFGLNDMINDLYLMSECKIKDANGHCQMSATQLAYSNTNYMYKLAAFSGSTIVIAELAGSLCKFKNAAKLTSKDKFKTGDGKAMQAAEEAVEGGCDVVNGVKDLVSNAAMIVFNISLVLIVANTLASNVGLFIGVLILIYPHRSFIPLIGLTIYTIFVEAIQMLIGVVFGRARQYFEKTKALLSEAGFQIIFFPLMILFLFYTLTTPVISGAIYDLVSSAMNANSMNPYSVIITGLVHQIVNLAYIWFCLFAGLKKVEGSSREIFRLTSNHMNTDTGNVSFAQTAAYFNIYDRATRTVQNAKTTTFGHQQKPIAENLKNGAKKILATKERESTNKDNK